jgi:hypothetical protein
VRPASPPLDGTQGRTSPKDAASDDPENPELTEPTQTPRQRLADVLDLLVANDRLTLDEAEAVSAEAEHLDGPALERLAGDLEAGE